MNLGNFLVLGALVFAVGAYGVLTRRNVIFIFLSLEVMFGGIGLTLVGFSGLFPGTAAIGQAFVLFILAVAAAETALGLGIFLALQRRRGTVAVDEVHELKG